MYKRQIQEAAAKALPGDEVIVAPGLYREAVNPIHAGTADKRITYRSAIKGQAHITGSEAVKDWENVEGTVWKAVIPNGIFGDYNPFTTLVSGDWFIATFIAHTGDVYLNEKSMYEVTTCLLYTSDAADERSSGDLCGRRTVAKQIIR